MITSIHTLIYSDDAQATRAFQAAVRFASFRQIGHVLTTGHSFRLLNDDQSNSRNWDCVVSKVTLLRVYISLPL